MIYNEDKFYYNRKIVEYDQVLNFDVSDNFLSLTVESSLLFFKLQDDVHIEMTEKNQEVFESIVSTLLSEHGHKQGFVS